MHPAGTGAKGKEERDGAVKQSGYYKSHSLLLICQPSAFPAAPEETEKE